MVETQRRSNRSRTRPTGHDGVSVSYTDLLPKSKKASLSNGSSEDGSSDDEDNVPLSALADGKTTRANDYKRKVKVAKNKTSRNSPAPKQPAPSSSNDDATRSQYVLLANLSDCEDGLGFTLVGGAPGQHLCISRLHPDQTSSTFGVGASSLACHDYLISADGNDIPLQHTQKQKLDMLRMLMATKKQSEPAQMNMVFCRLGEKSPPMMDNEAGGARVAAGTNASDASMEMCQSNNKVDEVINKVSFPAPKTEPPKKKRKKRDGGGTSIATAHTAFIGPMAPSMASIESSVLVEKTIVQHMMNESLVGIEESMMCAVANDDDDDVPDTGATGGMRVVEGVAGGKLYTYI